MVIRSSLITDYPATCFRPLSVAVFKGVQTNRIEALICTRCFTTNLLGWWFTALHLPCSLSIKKLYTSQYHFSCIV